MRAIAELTKSKIAVHAEDTKSKRIAVVLQPLIDIASMDCFPVFRPITINMVNREKLHMGISATYAACPPIGFKGFYFTPGFIFPLRTPLVAAVIGRLLLYISFTMDLIVRLSLFLMCVIVLLIVLSYMLFMKSTPFSVVLMLLFLTLVIHKTSITQCGYFEEFFKEKR